ncbi:hypothetical protein V6N13_129975 [Hibiscus sabdariffa]|uniref:DUF7745 domain-containing protein n=1 Tax=Hibiscus sabdariffa TaxID=183260 RepID=A0ABR2SMV0_9ROSI
MRRCDTGQRATKERVVIAYLEIMFRVDEPMLQALIQFWNLSYCCFTLNGKDLMPTVEEYTELLRVPNIKGDRVYIKPGKGTNFSVCLKDLAGRSIQWATGLIKKKGGSSGFSWSCIAEITRTYPYPHKKAQLLAVAIYGLVVFPRILGYIDVAILDLFDQLEHGINPVPAILAETFISLNACRDLEGGRFRGCAPCSWFGSKAIFGRHPERNLQEQDLVWRTPWLRTRNFLYRCYEYNWLMLLGLWGGIGCAPLLVSRQFGSRQFIPFTHGLSDSEFVFEGEFKKKIKKIYLSWKHCYRVKTAGSEDNMVTPDYVVWI